MSRSSSTSARVQPVTVDDELEICRDERCGKLAIHPKHDVPFSRRGRKRRMCPTCKEPLRRVRDHRGPRRSECPHCGYVHT